MTADPAIPNRLDASPADTILSWMQGQTVTQGWDVVCAIAIDKINEWFLQQYVDRLSGGELHLLRRGDRLPTVLLGGLGVYPEERRAGGS